MAGTLFRNCGERGIASSDPFRGRLKSPSLHLQAAKELRPATLLLPSLAALRLPSFFVLRIRIEQVRPSTANKKPTAKAVGAMIETCGEKGTSFEPF